MFLFIEIATLTKANCAVFAVRIRGVFSSELFEPWFFVVFF